MKKIIPLLLFVLLAAANVKSQSAFIYVSATNGNDTNDGLTPATAFKSFFQALSLQFNATNNSIVIRAEGGLYKTTDGWTNPNDRDFYLLFTRNRASDSAKRLTIEGGYNFTTGIRDIKNNPTILDGDIGVPGDHTDNSYHIASINRNSAESDSIIIDGLIFQNGGDLQAPQTVAPALWYGNDQLSRANGGALYVSTTAGNKVLLNNCIFNNNHSSIQGGAVHILGTNGFNFKNCVFTNNVSREGGAISIVLNNGKANIMNCVIARNKAFIGAAVSMLEASADLINSTVACNRDTVGNVSARGVIRGGILTSSGLNNVQNCAFWGNGKDFRSFDVFDIQYSNLAGGIGIGANNIDVDPNFSDTSNLTGPDGVWMTQDDGLAFAGCTPLQDKGNNAAVTQYGITKDIIGNDRIFIDAVDMGAYESQSFVTAYLDGDGDGYGVNLVGGLGQRKLVCGATSYPGYALNNLDCNDTDNNINPAATEICDGIDNNCNGQIDEGVQTAYYIDNDGDGYGSTLFGAAIFSCSSVAGRVANNTDCDDTRNTVYAGAPELCDGLDNNCNGQTDEGVGNLYYRDVDGDGYGNDNVTILACSLPGGYALVGGDCSDNTFSVNPGVAEICGDGIDNNCNGLQNEGFVTTRYYRDIDDDGYGNPAVFADLCAPLPGYVTESGDCNDLNGNIRPGAVEIVGNNIDDNCNGLVDEPNTWTGTVSSDWSNPANWSAGVVPTASTDGTIPSNVSRFPVLSADASVRVLDIKAGASLTIGANTLTVEARIPGRGVLRGSSASNLVLGLFVGTTFPADADTLWMDQSVDGSTNVLNSLRYLSANGGLQLGNKLVITDYYEPYATGTLFSDGNLVLRSTAAKTARVVAPAFRNAFNIQDQYIQGDVTVERYIPMNEFQAWRMLAVPVKGTQTIKQAWQENQAAGVVGTAGLGTTITTAAGYLQNGFDRVTTKTSLQTYNPATGGLVNCTSTLIPIESKYGYFMYVRGDRSVAINTITTPVNATTLRTKGALYLGPQEAVTAGANKYLMVGNPYACPVDFTQLVRTGGIGATFYIWDPRIRNGSSLGAYQTFSAVNGYQPVLAGGSYSGSNTRIESGMAIMVYAAGSAGSIQFTEAAKIGGSSNNGFRPAKLPASIKISLMKKDNGSEEMIAADAGIIAFDDRYSNAVDGDDAVKMMNPTENISIINKESATALAIEARGPVNDKSESVVLQLSNIDAENYRLQFDFTEYESLQTEVFIEDTKLNTVTQLSPASNIYEFTADSKTDNSSRFRIVFKKNSSNENADITVSPNPNTGSVMNISYTGLAGGKAAVRLMDAKGTVIYNNTVQLTANKGIQLINLPNKPTSSVYLIEMVDANGKHLVKKVMFN